MRTVEHYICEVCGTEYRNPATAKACEGGHKKAVEVIGYRYRPISDDKTGYPQTVTVRMDDGKTLVFKR